jgi:hypothetical protein
MLRERWVDVDVTRGARTATGAEREDLIDPVVTDRFHDRPVRFRVERALFTGTSNHDQARHYRGTPKR